MNIPVSDGLQMLTRTRLLRALRPFASSVEGVDVRIEDVNRPEGGIDKQCSMTADLTQTRQNVVVKSTSSDAYTAVVIASDRLGDAVSRALMGTRRPDRDSATASSEAEPQEESRIRITTDDERRLRKLIADNSDGRDRDFAQALADELDRAEVVPPERIADDVVTMNSRLILEDEHTGEHCELFLVYPYDSGDERVSVLSAFGSAILGLSVGQTVDLPVQSGHDRRLRIVQIVYQPEEAGHWPPLT